MRNVIAFVIGVFMCCNVAFAGGNTENVFIDPESKTLFIDCELSEGIIQEIIVWDREGKQVQVIALEGELASTNSIIELNNLEEDWYFIEVSSNERISWYEVSL